MSRRLTLAFVFLFAFCLSVMSVFAQETDTSTAGQAEIQSFFNNLGINAEVETNALPEPRTDEANWCTQTNRWGDGRCNNSNTWVHRYNWWIGWVLAHCETPGYFPLEDMPEECNWMLGASSVDAIFAGLYYVSPSNNSSVNGLGDTGGSGSVGGGIVTTPVPTDVSTDTPTDTPTEEPTDTPTDEPTDTPTDVPTDVPTDTPTDEPTDVPTDTPTDEPTDTPTDVPTEEPTDTPTEEPTDTPTEEPTDTPTDEPTDTPTDVPTDTPTEEPTEIPNEAPVASFTHTCTNLGCSFDATSSGDSDGTIVSYAWTFGDNASGSGVNSSHTYGSANSYTVTLTVTDDDGATASMDVSLTVPQYTNLVASYTCSGSNVIVTIVSGDAPFRLTGGGQPINNLGLGSHNVGNRNAITVTEPNSPNGDGQSVSFNTNCP